VGLDDKHCFIVGELPNERATLAGVAVM
jgi:hypothetical protein